MRNARFVVFGVILAVAVAAAVAGLVAQTRQEPLEKRPGPRFMMLDGRGGQLGVVVQDLDADGLKAGAGAASGVRIQDVDQDGPAAKAGIREGDIVVDVDGDRVRSARQFSRLIQETAEGRSVRLGIVRNGQRQTIDVTPEARPFAFGFDTDRIGRDIERSLRDLEPRLREFRYGAPYNFDFEFPRLTSPRTRLGIQLGDLPSQLAEYFGAKDGGVLVSSIRAGSPAEKAGLKAGDVIVTIDGRRVRDADDLVDELRDKDGEVAIGILRDKKESTLKATMESRSSPPRRPGRPV